MAEYPQKESGVTLMPGSPALDAGRWLLPEGIEELLPEQAWCLEGLRRRLLDLYRAWGYELVIPPQIEFLESLLTGVGHDLALQTFTLTDQVTGRLMGVRADMTPQVARIDARRIRTSLPTRLCYLGTVLHTRATAQGGTRSPLQVGAELYGHLGVESDAEVLGLMLETLRATGLDQVHLDLGHVGIYRGLAGSAGLTDEAERVLFEALQRKARPEVDTCLRQLDIDGPCREQLAALADLNGDRQVLAEARRVLAGAPADVHRALDDLERLADLARQRSPGFPLYFDLAELRGYHYHTGPVFAAYVPGLGQAVAQGGRYDDIGRVFGHARPATGFSADLKTLAALTPQRVEVPKGILAPSVEDPELYERVAQLRGRGERVLHALPGVDATARRMGCDRELVQRDGGWTVVPLAALDGE